MLPERSAMTSYKDRTPGEILEDLPKLISKEKIMLELIPRRPDMLSVIKGYELQLDSIYFTILNLVTIVLHFALDY